MKRTATICEFIGGPLDGLLAPVRPFTCRKTGKPGLTIEFENAFSNPDLGLAMWLMRQPLNLYVPDLELARCTFSPPDPSTGSGQAAT